MQNLKVFYNIDCKSVYLQMQLYRFQICLYLTIDSQNAKSLNT